MDDPGSQTGKLVARWRRGDQQAASELFHRYADRLVRLVRQRLPSRLAARLDPEDVVQSVYRSFFVEARQGRYDLERGGDLWRLLVTITLNKLHNQVKHNSRGKRSAQREQPIGLDAQPWAHAPSPAEAATLADELEQIMRQLEPNARRTLEFRLRGYNVDEIAAELHCSERTVLRILERLRQRLEGWPNGDAPLSP